MKLKVVLLALGALVISCNAYSLEEKNTDAVGTHGVVFTPLRSGGKLTACTLNFTAIFEDRTHINKKPYVLSGHVGVYNFDNNLAFVQKTGYADANVAALKIEKPFSAYVETKTNSTASLDKKTFTGDNNFLFSMAGLDETVTALIEEIQESKALTVGFNTIEGGVDFLVPIDLRVSSATGQPNGSYKRKFSDKATDDYIECTVRLVSEAIGAKK
ncbi:hypothetical protein J2X84_005244 [Pseudomonas corrugata]|uniref:hypothetical protein n=1 Tax=Pseudomonas corrugata TaxID=47879 RepID=UPI00285EC590|nr:hypothetical protein [Pseudomonas corrugata]MDR7286380.1 hypothetical protein [Pseudomonas corrugata]